MAQQSFDARSNTSFIAALTEHAPESSFPVVTAFTAPPDKLLELGHRKVWSGRAAKPGLPAPDAGNTFITVSSFWPDARGNIRRTKQSFAALLAVMIDDIGTKVEKPKLKPSYFIETSPDNFQAWYLLTEPLTNREEAERLIEAVINKFGADGKDPGMAGVTRYGRLPCGFNNKTKYPVPFDHRVHVWEPQKRFSVEALVSGLNLELAPPKTRSEASRRASAEAQLIETAIYEAQLEQDGNEYKIDVICPWSHEHSDGGKDPSGASYMFPSEENDWLGGFKCHHGHCTGRNIGHFVAELEKRTGKTLTLTQPPSAAEDFGIEQAVKKFEGDFELDFSELKPIEFVVNQFIPTGLTVIAGPAGGGKTTGILPLAAHAAWLLEDDGMRPDLRRHIVYVTEDPLQVERILYAMLDDHHLDMDEVKKWFHVRSARRVKPTAIAARVLQWQKEYSYDSGPEFNNYITGPLIVFDTTSANFELDSENDNSEVGHAIAAVKNVLNTSTACWLVTHFSKTTSRSDVNAMSIRGASAFEADAQTTVYLVQEAEERFLMLGKRRFSTKVKAMAFTMYSKEYILMAPWGIRQDTTVIYTLPKISEVTPAELKAEKREDAKDETVNRIKQDIIQVIKNKGPMSFRGIEENVAGAAAQIRGICKEMIQEGQLITAERKSRGGGFEVRTNPDYCADSFDEKV